MTPRRRKVPPPAAQTNRSDDHGWYGVGVDPVYHYFTHGLSLCRCHSFTGVLYFLAIHHSLPKCPLCLQELQSRVTPHSSHFDLEKPSQSETSIPTKSTT